MRSAITDEGRSGDVYPLDEPNCDPVEQCTTRRLDDGSLRAIGHTAPNSAGSVTYVVNVIRSDGVAILLRVSNESDPQGGDVLAPEPPLTTDQMTSIVTSDLW